VDGSLIVAIVAVGISAISLLVSGLFARSSHKQAKAQAKRDTERAERERQQFKEEQERGAQQKELGLSAIYGEGPTPTEGGHEYRYELVNTSDVPIDNPTGWLVDEAGTALSERTPGTPAYMLPEERGELRVVAHSIERPLTLHLAWLDVRGQHPDKTSKADVPLKPAGRIGRGRGGVVE
jgi:hypothetical protein